MLKIIYWIHCRGKLDYKQRFNNVLTFCWIINNFGHLFKGIYQVTSTQLGGETRHKTQKLLGKFKHPIMCPSHVYTQTHRTHSYQYITLFNFVISGLRLGNLIFKLSVDEPLYLMLFSLTCLVLVHTVFYF